MKIFQDTNTKIPIDDSYLLSKAAKPDHVYMDTMGFGLGCSCLQITFQACNIQEARTLYDQLTPLSPIMLALTAASPIFRGIITEVDCRWNIISASVDCRTQEERGLKPLKENKFVINKSRYGSVDSYLSEIGEKYNDIPILYDQAIYQKLRNNDVDHLLAQHVAHLFIRGPISLFAEKINQDDENDVEHFENFLLSNYQTLRLKPPPLNSTIGWRVEFRPCEVQTTDFENAAFVCFTLLLTRVILSYDLNFLIPISKVDENLEIAQKRGACLNGKFWFRKDIFTRIRTSETNGYCKESFNNSNEMYDLMTIKEIIDGKVGKFPGLIFLINTYLNDMDVDADTHCSIQQYLKFIQQRASGEILTTASWIRQFVTNHPEYKHDSKVSERINYDLLNTMHKIQMHEICPELLGHSLNTRTKETIPQALNKEVSDIYEFY